MKTRDLTPLDSRRKGSKEFNHLRITNMDQYLSHYQCNLDYYASPFKVLAELEEQIKFENNPEKTVLVSYKPDGDVIFDLVGIEEKDDLRIVKYEFATFIS